MRDDTSLARAYRRLLLVYPRRYRRERGAEIVSTLLDAARPGQQHPTRREAADLILGGLRCRFSVPPGPSYKAVTVVAAFVFGVGVSALAAWWSWGTSEIAPTAATGVAVGREITPREPRYPPHIITRDTLLSDVRMHGMWAAAGVAPSGGEAGLGHVDLTFELPTAELDAAIAQARARLADSGWSTGDPVAAQGTTMFWAERGHLAVSVHAIPARDGVTPNLWVQVHRTQPGGVSAAAAIGLVAGAAGGWLLAARVLRRFRAHGPRTRAVLVVIGVPSLIVGGLTTAGIVADTLGSLFAGVGWSSRLAVYPASLLIATMPLPALSLLGLVAAVGVAATRTGAGQAPTREVQGTYLWRYGARTVAAIHLTFAACWLAVFIVYRWTVGDDREGMLRMEHDPMELVGGDYAHPLGLLWVATDVLFLIGSVVSPVLLAVSVPLLMAGRGRAERLTKALLLVAIISAIALPLTWLSQLQQDLTTWILD